MSLWGLLRAPSLPVSVAVFIAIVAPCATADWDPATAIKCPSPIIVALNGTVTTYEDTELKFTVKGNNSYISV